MAKPTTYRAPAVVRAFALLEEVARAGEPAGVSQLAARLDLGKSTVHGLVKALMKVGALEPVPGTKKVRLGTIIHDLSVEAVNWPRLSSRIRPELESLCRELGHTVCLGILGPRNNLILAAAEPQNSLKISAPPGTRLPLLAGALGKLILAGLDNDKALAMLSKHGLTGRIPSNLQWWLRELEQVRRKGYAVDRQEYLPGVVAVAVRLKKEPGPVLALWCVGLAAGFSENMLLNTGRILVARRTELAALMV